MNEKNTSKPLLTESVKNRIRDFVNVTFKEIKELEQKLDALEPKKELEAVEAARDLYHSQLAELLKENLSKEEYSARREELFKPLADTMAALNEARPAAYTDTLNRIIFLHDEIAQHQRAAYQEVVNELIQGAGDDLEQVLQAVKQQITAFIDNYKVTAELPPESNFSRMSGADLFTTSLLIQQRIEELVVPFRDALEQDPEALEQLNTAISEALAESTQTIDALPALTDLKQITRAIAMHDKVTNKIFSQLDLTYGKRIPIGLEGEKSRKEITTSIILYSDNPDSLISKVRFTDFERRVYEACVTLFYNGKTFLTWRGIYRAMLGDPSAEPTAKKTKQIINCIEKFTTHRVEMDVSQAARAWGKDPRAKLDFKEHLLMGRICHIRYNGAEAEGIELAAEPVLFKNARITNQFDTISPEVLRLPSGMNATDENLILIRDLYQKVSTIIYKKANKQNYSDHIALDSLYELFGITGDDAVQRRKKMNLRNNAEAILNNWQKNKAFDGFTAWHWLDTKGEVIKRQAKTKTKPTKRTRAKTVSAIWIVTPQARLAMKKKATA